MSPKTKSTSIVFSSFLAKYSFTYDAYLFSIKYLADASRSLLKLYFSVAVSLKTMTWVSLFPAMLMHNGTDAQCDLPAFKERRRFKMIAAFWRNSPTQNSHQNNELQQFIFKQLKCLDTYCRSPCRIIFTVTKDSVTLNQK